MKLSLGKAHGVTLTELMVTVGILGLVASMSTVGVQFLNRLTGEKAVLEMDRNAQVVLYQISRDIRNAAAITSIRGDKLILRSYNFQSSYDNKYNPNIFNDIGTITYEYKEDTSGSWLQRTVDFASRDEEKRLLPNLLVKPSNISCSSSEHIFSPFPVPDSMHCNPESFPPPNYSGGSGGVEIILNLDPKVFKRTKHAYRDEVMMRAR